MGGFDAKAAARRMACLVALAAATADMGAGQPVTLRLGYGTAAEEPLWVVVTKPDLAKNYGKAYALDATRFTGSDKRSQAFEAGAIDLAAQRAAAREHRNPHAGVFLKPRRLSGAAAQACAAPSAS